MILFGPHVAVDVCLALPHRQFVWTIPKRLRVFFRFHLGLLNRLPRLAWETNLELYRAVLSPDAIPSGVLPSRLSALRSTSTPSGTV